MIEQIQNLPANMVGFRATGEVTREDFEPVFGAVQLIVLAFFAFMTFRAVKRFHTA